jgi:hypothetical protein
VPDVAAPKPLAEPKSFVGELSLDHDASAVGFRVGIDANGEIELEFDPIPLNNQTKFILLGWDRDRSQITYFSLKGVAEDGTRFETSHLSFTSLGKYSDASGTPMPPTDPLIYRFYELVMVNGPAWKALIEEEFGGGIMSAIDYDMVMERLPDPKGDRVKITMSGKFLPYKYYGATGNALAYGLKEE